MMGTLGVWSVIPGDSEQLLWIQIQVVSGTLPPPLGSRSNVQIANLAGVSVQLQVALQFIPTSTGPAVLQLPSIWPQLGNGADRPKAVTSE